MKLTCIIIDDEFLARQYLKEYIKKVPFLELAGDYNSPLKAIDEMRDKKIDLIFLDIQMPGLNGIDFIKTLDSMPFIILTTAYKEYALEGYELNVTDYLLKPFPFERFIKAVNKVAEQVEHRQQTGQHSAAATEIQKPQIHDNYLVIRADRKHYLINYDDLIYIEGQKAYVTFYTRNEQITALASLKELEDRLPNDRFIRIHKSFIVSIKKIHALEGNSIEINRKQLPIGKSYSQQVHDLFGLNG